MRRLLATSALAATLIVGCGDDEDGARTVTVNAARVVRVVADEYSFDPTTVVYKGGGATAEFALALDNRGSLAHNLKVIAGGRQVGGTPTFPGGREELGRLELEPGDYRMVCTVGDHERLGMTGTLEVR